MIEFILVHYANSPRLGSELPSESKDVNEFVKMSERASECRVKRRKDVVKLKLRTAKRLYTFRVAPEKAAELLKQVRCEVIEA